MIHWAGFWTCQPGVVQWLEGCSWRCTSSCPHSAPASADQRTGSNRKGYNWGRCRLQLQQRISNKEANLLRGAVRMVQVDGDLTLTGAERVHSELSGTPHPVARPFNTCSRKNVTRSPSSIGTHSLASRITGSVRLRCFKIQCVKLLRKPPKLQNCSLWELFYTHTD